MRTPEDPEGPAIRRSLLLARARDLSERLRLPVIVTEFEWLGTDVEIEIARRADGSILPVKMLIGPGATDLLILDHDGVHGRFRRYNKVIGELRALAKQLADCTGVVPGSPIAYARAMLSGLDEFVDRRERAVMMDGVVRLARLDRAIDAFTRYLACFAVLETKSEVETHAKPSFRVPAWRRSCRRSRWTAS